MTPYYEDEHVTLYHGDMRDVLPALGAQADAIVTDPPYKATSLKWDRWPAGWPTLAAQCTSSLWCFGSLRLFMSKTTEFETAGWKLSHDKVGEYEIDTSVWEKHNAAGPSKDDRFRVVHEFSAHFYRGRWEDIHHHARRVPHDGRNQGTRRSRVQTPHTGKYGSDHQPWADTGTRLPRSVTYARSMKGSAIHPTQKPEEIVRPLLEHAVPDGGTVLDPFAGSCTTLVVARELGIKAIGIEAHEPYCEAAAKRLSIPDLFGVIA